MRIIPASFLSWILTPRLELQLNENTHRDLPDVGRRCYGIISPFGSQEKDSKLIMARI